MYPLGELGYWYEDGGKSQRVDIHYKFIGYFPLGEILAGARHMPLTLWEAFQVE